jgi:hypothetical protein
MTRSLFALVMLGAGLLAPSCTVTPATDDCERACAVASRCGLLPSALGGAVDEPRAHNEASCVARCVASEADDPQVTDLLARLGEEGELPDDQLCSMQGLKACDTLIDALERAPDSELEITTMLTVRMVNLVSQVAAESLDSWCCFDHRYDLDGIGDGVDELDEVYDMFEPTYVCAESLRTAVSAAASAAAMSETLDPMAPDFEQQQLEAMMEVQTQCMTILDLWRERMPSELPDASDVCTYARQSTSFGTLPIPRDAEECLSQGGMAFVTLVEQIERLELRMHLEAGGLLIDEGGALRELEDVRAQLQDKLHDVLAHPGAPLENACRAYIGTADVSGCETLDRDALAQPVECEVGPACSPADCLDESPACNATLCDAQRSPPGRDCGELGVTEVRLGYRNAQGLEVLGDPLDGCEALTEVTTTFEHVKVGRLVPIAVVSGTLPTFLSHEATSRPFSWIVLGESQWVTAGAAELEVPSPLLSWKEDMLENPLEALDWVPRRLPVGKPCDLEPAQCEGYFSDNCDNGIDDDSDGLVDDDSAWCDELMRTLVERCVVSEPGRERPEACRRAPP